MWLSVVGYIVLLLYLVGIVKKKIKNNENKNLLFYLAGGVGGPLFAITGLSTTL